MADQEPAAPGTPAPAAGADPAAAQYVISITPEQYISYRRQAEAKDAPPRAQLEMGGSGTAKASFKNAADGDVEITVATWSSTGPVVVTADEDDPTSAKIVPTGLGPATITVNVTTVDGSAQTSTDLMVISKIGAPVAGTIEITVEAPAEGEEGVPVSGPQTMPVPPPAPPQPYVQTVPPAQVMSQPSPQPQPESKSESQPAD